MRSLINSLTTRFIRLRFTALLYTLVETTTVNRLTPEAFLKNLIVKYGLKKARPLPRVKEISLALARRFTFFSIRKTLLLYAYLLTAFGATAGQYGPSGPGLHALQETMDALPMFNFWLIGSFHTTVIIQKISYLVNSKKTKI